MTYTAPGAMTFRRTGGDLDKKITDELALIDTELDTANTRLIDVESYRVKYVRPALVAGNANAFAFNWENTTGGTILISKVVVDVTTPGGTGGAVLDVGTGATATTHNDNIIDGADLNATAIYDNVTDKGTNGKTVVKLTTGQFITGQILTQNAAALVGKAYIYYNPI